MERTHFGQHGDACFGCRIQTINIAPSVFETTPGGAKAASNKRREGELVKDLAAFRRMRLAGEQPRSTRGAAKVESQAESSFEVASGQLAHEMAKGPDAGKPIAKRGKEWRRRTEDAHKAVRRGETISA